MITHQSLNNSVSVSVREANNRALADQGEQLSDPSIFRDLEQFANEIGSVDSDWDQDLQRGTELIRRFEVSLKQAGIGDDVLHARYYLILGGALKRVQRLLHDLDHEWTSWVKENLTTFSIRTAGQPVKVAKLANPENYIVLGTDRLKQIAAIVGELGGNDPIGDFLKQHGISYSLEDERPLPDLLIEVDTALTFERFRQSQLGIFPRGKIHQLVQLKLHQDSQVFSDLQLLKQNGKDVKSYLDLIIQTGKKVSTTELETLKKLSKFTTLGEECFSIAEVIEKDESLRVEIDIAQIDGLIESLTTLKSKVQAVENNQESSS